MMKKKLPQSKFRSTKLPKTSTKKVKGGATGFNPNAPA